MLELDEKVDGFRRGELNIDCKSMALTQHKEDGERFEGQGYIRQADDGALIFKIYVTKHNATLSNHLAARFSGGAGKLLGDGAFYDLEATGYDNTRWTATRVLPDLSWDATDMTVLVHGKIQSMTGHLDRPQSLHYLRLHFFEEYHVPLSFISKTERYGNPHHIADHAKFEACAAKFEVWQRESSADTIVELTSETPLPGAFDLRIQEALQYLTAKPAFWRVKLRSHDNELRLELSSPRRKSARTQFSPPISHASSDFLSHGWRLFAAYLAYLTENTQEARWNPVAYHLNNACEATANSMDAWAVGISVAVEAVTGLITIGTNDDQVKELKNFQECIVAWVDEQKGLSKAIIKRVKGQIEAMNNKRPQDTLYALATAGRVEKKYVDAWSYLRNKHVHPRLLDLQMPTQVDIQKLLDHIHMVEVLLRQLTFHLFDYCGPFTDYGAPDFPIRQYPLRPQR